MKKNKLLLSIFTLSLASCTMMPDYIRPDFSANQQWEAIPQYITPNGSVAAQKLYWNTYFDSPGLKKVINVALDNNKDLALATINIEKAKAIYGIEKSNLTPTINGNIGANYQESSDASSFTGVGESNELYNANLGVSNYELDLFGRIRSLSQSARNEFLASKSAQETVRNTLIAETANAYLTYLANIELLNLTQQTLIAQEKTYNILLKTLDVGVATKLDVGRAKTAVESAQVNLHLYRRLAEQSKNALYLLMGVSHSVAEIVHDELNNIEFTATLDEGLPSETLLARPDIRQAEYELMASNADIGAARAAFFPRIALTGNFGFASENLSKLFTNSAFGAWSFVPQITIPIFTNRQNKLNLDLAELRKDEKIVQYEQAIQTAFKEVSDELVARATITEQLNAQQRLVEAASNVYDISNARYRSGIDNFLSVLDSQRELYTAEQNLIDIKKQSLINSVNLYRVLGGGKGDF